ncbi:MAG TPA: aldo/keto reductase [Chthoniobacteraceae bacterium]|jgi:aryl-alcohol dehydrogenase-like predicted oxidoreductase|nr:aldo/keto reductase [Chthoniobacteraceae bacterium]
MKKRPLGKTNLMVSEIGVGAWQLGGPLLLDGIVDGHPELGREYCVKLIRDAGQLGVNFIDTAEQYGNGESERRVGEALEGRREEWVIGTKFGAQVGPKGERVNDATPARVPVSLENSLRRLRTDHIDIYLYHCAPKPGEAESVAEFLTQARQQGKIRAAGISTNDLSQVEYLHSLGCLDVVQYAKNMMEPNRKLSEWVASHGAGGVVRGAFAGGRLSGRYFRQPPKFGADDIRSRWTGEKAGQEFARYAAFEELLSSGRGMIQLALRFLLDEPGTSTIIPGGKSLHDYQEAIRAAELPPLTEAEKQRIATLRDEIRSAAAVA